MVGEYRRIWGGGGKDGKNINIVYSCKILKKMVHEF